MDGTGVRVRVLGAVDASGGRVALGPRKQRALLVRLLLERDGVVSIDRLVDDLWGHTPPTSALASLYSYVSNLRRVLGGATAGDDPVIASIPPGYAVRSELLTVDVDDFERHARTVAELLDRGDVAAAGERARRALELWPGGHPFGEFHDAPWAASEAVRLAELRLALAEHDLEGRLLELDPLVIADLERFVADHPLRERGWGLLMRALHANGRQSDALRAYQRARTQLDDVLGVGPGPELRAIERAVRTHDLPVRSAATDAHVAASTTHAVADASSARPGSIVGRTVEIDACLDTIDASHRGPRSIVIEGEPGIGKTRLLEEVSSTFEQRGAVVAWGRSLDAVESPALWSWIPPLRRLLEVVPVDAEVSTIRSALSPTPTTEDAVSGFEFADAVVELIEAVAALRPVMIVFDDVQWADQASLELLTLVITRLSSPGVVLAATCRSLDVGQNDEKVAALAALTRMTGSCRLHLEGLDAGGTAELLRAASGSDVDGELVDAVHRRAEGNPLFIDELARLLGEGGSDTSTAVGDIPYGIRDVLLQRLRTLPDETSSVLGVAGVMGLQFDTAVVARAMQLHDVMAVLERLEPAVVRRLVVHDDDRPGTYRFAHGLLREVIVGELGPARSATAHAALAAAMEDSDDDAEVRAEHMWAAGPLIDRRDVARQHERAARTAMRRGALASALRLLERAADIYRAMGDARGESSTLTEIAAVAVFQGGFVASLDSPALTRARRLLVDRDVGDQQIALRVLECVGRNVACDFDVADRMASDLLAIAENHPDAAVSASCHLAYASNCWYHGRLDLAVHHFEVALTSPTLHAGATERTSVDVVHDHLPAASFFHVRSLMDGIDDERVVALRHRIEGDALWDVVASFFITLSAVMVGDRDRALSEATLGIERDPTMAFGRWSAGVAAGHAVARGLHGDVGAVASLIESADALYVPYSQRTSMAIVFAGASLGLTQAGMVDLGTRAAELARREIEPHRDLYPEPIVLAAEAHNLLAIGGDDELAGRLFNRAVLIAERQGARAVVSNIERLAGSLDDPAAPVAAF